MKRIVALISLALVCCLGQNFAQTNGLVLKKPIDYYNNINQLIKFNVESQNDAPFYLADMTIAVEANGDGLLDTMIAARFPNRNNPALNDESKWSFVNRLSKNGEKHVYKVRYQADSLNVPSRHFLPGNNWLLAEEFIKFFRMPTTGTVTITITELTVVNQNYIPLNFAIPEPLVINLGPSQTQLRLTGPIEINANDETFAIDLEIKNPSTVGEIWLDLAMQEDYVILDKYALAYDFANWSVDLLSNVSGNYRLHLDSKINDWLPTNNWTKVIKLNFKVKKLTAGQKLEWFMLNVKIFQDMDELPVVLPYEPLVINVLGAGRIKGDLDGDGVITLLDIIIAFQHCIGWKVLTGQDFWAADINDNGVVDMSDLDYIKEKAGYQLYDIITMQHSQHNILNTDGTAAVVAKGSQIKNIPQIPSQMNWREFTTDGQFFAAKFSPEHAGKIIFNSEANFTWSYQLILRPSGVNDQLISSDLLTVYPNPAQETISLNWQEPTICCADIWLINSLGQSQLLSSNTALQNFTWTINDLPAGHYLIQIKKDGELLSSKSFIKL